MDPGLHLVMSSAIFRDRPMSAISWSVTGCPPSACSLEYSSLVMAIRSITNSFGIRLRGMGFATSAIPWQLRSGVNVRSDDQFHSPLRLRNWLAARATFWSGSDLRPLDGIWWRPVSIGQVTRVTPGTDR
jgi:hypothetical protein